MQEVWVDPFSHIGNSRQLLELQKEDWQTRGELTLVLENNSKVQALLREHKNLISIMGRTEEIGESLYANAERTGKTLALIFSRYRCETCGSTDNLQYHHLIPLANCRVIKHSKFKAQRSYFANIAILCKVDHTKVEREKRNSLFQNGEPNEMCIPQEKIDQIKKYYEEEP